METCGDRQKQLIPFFFGRKSNKLEIQGQLRSRHPHLKSVALNANAQRLQVALLVEIHYSLRYRSDNPGTTVILSSPTQKAGFMSNGYNLIRFQGGGGTMRQDFKDVNFGDLEWEDHIAIDPDRAYGINMADIDIYELKKFGAYAEDGQTTRIFTSGGNYYDSWIGFIGCENSQLPQVTVVENRVNSGKPKSGSSDMAIPSEAYRMAA